MKRFLVFFGMVFALALLTISLRPAVAGEIDKMMYAAPLPPGAALAGQNNKNRVVFPLGKGEYFLNDKTPGVKMDAVTFMENDRTYVPVRFLANALGITDGHIKWDDAAQVVTLEADNLKVKLAVGQKGVDVNGQITPTDVAPLMRKDRTYLPARFVAEALGFKVEWVGETEMVLVYWPGVQAPNDNLIYEYYFGDKTPATKPVINNVVDVPRDGGGGRDMTEPTEKPGVPWTS
ncbi:MAG: copper amine oxidase N-terminal domain-containing protein [Desulfocucumaceae bacterium]